MVRRSRFQLLLFYIAAANERTNDSSSDFRNTCTNDGRHRRQRRITRRALQAPYESAFTIFFRSGCNQSLITACGLDYSSFRELLPNFEPVYLRYTPYSSTGYLKRISPGSSRGRPKSMNATLALGLYLFWMRSRGPESSLCMIFGINGSVCNLFIKFSRRTLLRVFSREAGAAIRMPTDDEVIHLK